MASKEQKAREAGIEVRTHGADYRTPCPKCSPDRKKRKDPCLHVTIKTEAILTACFHCDYTGAFFDDDNAGPRNQQQQRGRPAPAKPAHRFW